MWPFQRKSRAAIDSTSIGNIFLRLGFITRKQLDHAIRLKVEGGAEELLGELLISTSAVTRPQLETALAIQHSSRNRHSSTAALAIDAARARTDGLGDKLDELHKVASRMASGLKPPRHANGHR
jgi:hypothetical protein